MQQKFLNMLFDKLNLYCIIESLISDAHETKLWLKKTLNNRRRKNTFKSTSTFILVEKFSDQARAEKAVKQDRVVVLSAAITMQARRPRHVARKP